MIKQEFKKENSKKKIIVKDHPSTVNENSSLSNVALPDAWYNLELPEKTVNSGVLSAPQLEAIVYSCQSHETKLADGSRAGFLIGDGAGVGKGRMAAGIILGNFLLGRKKAIWFSVSTDLKYDAERDLRDIGADQITVHALNQSKNSSAPKDVIGSIKEGVIFSTYSDLIAELSVTSRRKLSGLEQLLKWCGQDFDGVIIFDEFHHMNNINYGGSSNMRKIESALLELQNKVPNARIVYISTTVISELLNMASMIRLGLWGRDTPFQDFGEFMGTVKKFGEIAGNMVVTDLKQRGLYVNREICFKNVTFQINEVVLLPKCIMTYNSSVKLWVELYQSFTEAVKLADLGPNTQKILWTNFWSAHRKFFRSLCISAKVAHAIKLASEAVKRGDCVVIGLQSTGEAYTLKKIPKDRRYKRISNFVSTSKVIMHSLVEKYFPASDSLQLLADEARNEKKETVGGKRKCLKQTAATPKKKKTELTNDDSYCEIIDSRDACAPLFDHNSNSIDIKLEDEELVEDRKANFEKASLIKQQLLEKIEELGAILPPNWFDQLIDELGGLDNVAEISSRKGRVVQKNNGLIEYESRSETDVPLELINIRERERFMNGEKNIAIVSAAASSGISLQADRRVKNQRHRVYISLELPNSAEFALQQFGCTHRSNQVRAPEYIFLVSELAGDRRSALILANRLQCLGATYTNERFTKGSNKWNLDEINEYDRTVLDTINIFMERKSPVVPVPNYNNLEITSALVEVGLTSSNVQFPTKVEARVTEILNRILGTPVELQAQLLQYFIDVQSTISYRTKIDHHNYMKILDLGINKCVYRTKLLRFTSKNPIASMLPAKIELHEFEVDGGMSWKTLEEKWLSKSEEHEGFYLSKEASYGKKDIILIRRTQTVDDRADRAFHGNIKYTVIRPSIGVQALLETLDQIKINYTRPKNWFPKMANSKDMKLLWDFHYNASTNVCIHAYWKKCISKKNHPQGCKEGLRLCAKYKLLSGCIHLVWKTIESFFGGNMKIVRVHVESTSIVGVLIPDKCETEIINFMKQHYIQI